MMELAFILVAIVSFWLGYLYSSYQMERRRNKYSLDM
jgi:hypothetical protein